MEAFHGVARRITCAKIGIRFMLGLQSAAQKSIVNMNHLLFLVEVPNKRCTPHGQLEVLT